MFDDLPPDRERLHALRVWHALWLGRIDRKIAAVRKQQAGREQGERARPDPPLRLPGWGPDTPPTAPALHDRMWGRATAVCLRRVGPWYWWGRLFNCRQFPVEHALPVTVCGRQGE